MSILDVLLYYERRGEGSLTEPGNRGEAVSKAGWGEWYLKNTVKNYGEKKITSTVFMRL